MNEDIFDSIRQETLSAGPLAAAGKLVAWFRGKGDLRELFEALKMQSRIKLGISAVAVEGDAPLTSQQQDVLERDLIDACREVGVGFLKRGNLEEGWMYMRPVGDRAATAEALAQVPVTGDNLDAMLQLLVHEAIDVARGTRLSLEHRGTCNTITMMESVVRMRGRPEQQAGVRELVLHVHHELLTSLKNDIARRENEAPKDMLIEPILNARPGLLRDGTYHLDTTHLAATVRFARVLDDSEALRMALDLASYGRQLHPQYQYPSEEPFADLYPASIAFLRALLGQQVDAALRLFQQRAESLDTQEHGTVAIETYVDLLARVNRPNDAIQALIRMMPQGMRPIGIAPSLLEICQVANNFQPMVEQSLARRDVIGYAAGLLQPATLPKA